MTVSTLFLYLIGSEAAIREVAHSSWSVGIGLVFVVTAAGGRPMRVRRMLVQKTTSLLPGSVSIPRTSASAELVSPAGTPLKGAKSGCSQVPSSAVPMMLSQ